MIRRAMQRHGSVALPARSPAIQRARAPVRDTERLAALVRQNATFVWRSLRRLGVPELEADDASQHVFLTLSRKLPFVERGRERSFLFSIVIRIASNARRKVDRQAEHVDDGLVRLLPSSDPSPHELLEVSEARGLLDQALLAMPLAIRAAFVLFEIEDLSLSEVAALLEIPRGTAASRLRRAREILGTEVRRLRAKAGF
jgi:RNA polymerase sigma-70 factor (ECF subfamily)